MKHIGMKGRAGRAADPVVEAADLVARANERLAAARQIEGQSISRDQLAHDARHLIRRADAELKRVVRLRIE